MTACTLGPVLAGFLVVASVAEAQPRPAGPTTRTVYVTITDDEGTGVSDLTPADFVLKEGGKERDIVAIERASAKIRLSLAVEEPLMPDTQVRMGLFEFMKRMADSAEIRLLTMGVRTIIVVDYTSSLDLLVAGINGMSLHRPMFDTNAIESIQEMSREFSKEKPERPVMVLVCASKQSYGGDVRGVFAKLRDSRAIMFVAAWLGGLGGESQVLSDGPRQSGGRRLDVAGTNAMPRTLLQLANDLRSQYKITYTLPAGVRPNERFSLTAKPHGLSVRAPSAIPFR